MFGICRTRIWCLLMCSLASHEIEASFFGTYQNSAPRFFLNPNEVPSASGQIKCKLRVLSRMFPTEAGRECMWTSREAQGEKVFRLNEPNALVSIVNAANKCRVICVGRARREDITVGINCYLGAGRWGGRSRNCQQYSKKRRQSLQGLPLDQRLFLGDFFGCDRWH